MSENELLPVCSACGKVADCNAYHVRGFEVEA